MKLLRHEKIALVTGIVGVVLIILSCLPFGWSFWTGILQGIGTGLIAGVVLLFVSAARSKEEFQLSHRAEELNSLRQGIELARTIGDDFYHNVTRIRKNSTQEDYSDLIENYIQRFDRAKELIERFDLNVLLDDEAKQSVKDLRVMMARKWVVIHKQETYSMKADSLDHFRKEFREISYWFFEKQFSDKFCSTIAQYSYKANKELSRVIKSPV